MNEENKSYLALLEKVKEYQLDGLGQIKAIEAQRANYLLSRTTVMRGFILLGIGLTTLLTLAIIWAISLN